MMTESPGATDEALITLESNGLRVLELNPRAAELLGMTARDRASSRGADLRGWLAEESKRHAHLRRFADAWTSSSPQI